MRKLTLLPLFLIGVFLFSPSCKKKYPDANTRVPASQTIDVKIAPNQPYQISLTDQGTVRIERQALHFSVSETIANPETGDAVYKYVPAPDFAGTDEVLLLSSKTETSYSAGSGSGGCPASGSSSSSVVSNKYITFKITVAN